MPLQVPHIDMGGAVLGIADSGTVLAQFLQGLGVLFGDVLIEHVQPLFPVFFRHDHIVVMTHDLLKELLEQTSFLLFFSLRIFLTAFSRSSRSNSGSFRLLASS